MASKVGVLPPTLPSHVAHPPLRTVAKMFTKAQTIAPALVPATQYLLTSKRIPISGDQRPVSTVRASEGIVSDDGNEYRDDPSKIKADLYKAVQGINRGIFGIQSQKKLEIESLVKLLESQNPVPDPTANLDKLGGSWKLVFSTVTILGSKRTKLGLRDFISLGDLYQTINITEGKAINLIKFNVRGLSLLNGQLKIVASYQISSSSRVSISYENSTIVPDQLMNMFEKNYDTLLGIFNPEGWLDITYIDDELRIGRDDKGNIFILERSGTDVET